MFTMCFNKAKTQSDEETSMNNHSGYHYIGSCGAGKSFFLRVGCIISSLLLPRFTGVYVDYASIPHSNLPVHIAAQLALNEKADNIHLEPANDMSSVLDIAQANKLSVGLFLDEAQNVYESQNWSNIHTLVTSFQNAAFITGSESKLSHLIGSSTPADLAVVNSLGLKLLQSLNDTKVCKRYFGGFTTLKQYYHYLDYFTPTRDAIFPNFPNTPVEKIPKSKFELEKIHIRFNGRLRGIQDPSQYKTDLPSLPRTPPEIEVMNLFKERIDAAGFDAFAPFPVPEREIQECIENKFKDEKINTAVLLHNLVETKLLLQVPAGYILYSPIVYVWLLNHTRSVFVSHAFNNFEQIHNLVKKLLNPRSSNFIFSEDPKPSAVAKIPIEKWETKQMAAHEDLSNKRILVVLTKEYCEKVDSEQPNRQESDKPGCKREFLYLMKRFKDETKPKVTFCWFSDSCDNFDAAVSSSVLQQIRDNVGNIYIAKLEEIQSHISISLQAD